MDSLNLNLDQITQETFELGEQISFGNLEGSQDFFDDSRPDEAADNTEQLVVAAEEQKAVQETFPHSSGLIYKIEKTSGTFCIRALVCNDISEIFTKLFDGDSEAFSKVKIDEFILDDFFYFKTSSFERAEIIFDQIANRRFPLDEDSLCNISDPGFSWWMNIGEGSFQIHFNSHGLNRAERFVKLGPLGDGTIAAMRFEQLEDHLAKYFPISEMCINNKGIKVSTAALDNRSFYIFQSMFTDGINDSNYEDFSDDITAKTLFLYLKELCAIRSFWLEIESKIHNEYSVAF